MDVLGWAKEKPPAAPRTIRIFLASSAELRRDDDWDSLRAFQKKLTTLGHFWTKYDSVEHLKRQFRDQLDKLLDE